MQKFIKVSGNSDNTNVSLYIAKYNSDKQQRLSTIRSIILKQFPSASERIYYGIPTVELNDKIILQYAGYKNHISLIISYSLSLLLKELYPQYKYTDFSLILPDNQPFPADFIKEISGLLG